MIRRLATVALFILVPLAGFADQRDEVRAALRDVQLALSQISIQGKDAQTFVWVQDEIGRVTKLVESIKIQEEPKPKGKDSK